MSAWRAAIGWPARAAIPALLGLIWIYQRTISPLLGPTCIYQPSCSRYMAEALRKYGLVGGLARGIRRLLRCHPWGPGGYDPP